MSFRLIDPNIVDPVQHPSYSDEFNQSYYNELREAFRLFDIDNDGVITYTELFKVIKYLHKWDFIKEQMMNEELEQEEKRKRGELNEENKDSNVEDDNTKKEEQKEEGKGTLKSPKGKDTLKKDTTTKKDTIKKENVQKNGSRKGKKGETKENIEVKEETVEEIIPSPEDLFIIPDPTEEEIRDLIHYATGRLGVMDHITFEEFAKLMQRQIEDTEPEEHFREAFNIFDKDRDGFISMAELHDALINIVGIPDISQDDLSKFMKELDSDGDNLLSYEDFVKMFVMASQLNLP